MLKKHICPSCGAADPKIVYVVKNVPVNSCLLLSTEQEALNFPRGNVELGFCLSCGFIFNTVFDLSKVNYSSVYEDQQSFSSTFNAFAERLAADLVNRHGLHGKTVLEIGCGKGDFLELLCELGPNYGVGIDPAFIKGRIRTKAQDRLTFIQDYYTERYSNYQADFVCSRHTLEHVPNVSQFIQTIRRSIGNRLNTEVFFELPDVARVLHEQAFWDIYYEHCSYFSLGSLARLFRFCGFEVNELSTGFDNQYLLLEAKPAATLSLNVHAAAEESLQDLAQAVDIFSLRYPAKIDRWRRQLQQIADNKKRCAIWGSGSKCVSFLTTLDAADKVDYVVDINPFRHGRFLPGCGKMVTSPETLKENKPDITIVMNPAYCGEIQRMLNEMDVDTEVISV